MTATTLTVSTAPTAPRRSDWFLLAVPGMIWGASFLFIAEGLEATGPHGVAFVRILIGCLTLGLFRASRRAIPRREWGRIALLGVTWLAFPLSLFPFAEQRVTSALTGMLNGAVPLFAALVAAGMSRRAPNRGIAAGLAVGLTGAVLMAVPSLGQGRSSAAGILMIVAALISYGFAINIARSLQMQYGAVPVIWRAQVVAVALTAPFGVPEVLAAHWSPGPVFSLLALGALGTGVAFVVAATAAGQLGATRAAATAYLIPPVALALGVIVRGEHVAALSVLGGAVCLLGAWVMRRAQSDAPPAGAGAGSGAGLAARAPASVGVGAAAPRAAAMAVQPPLAVSAVRRPLRLWLTATKALMTLALLLAAASGARAQAPRVAGPNFLFFRYASHSSMAMYSGYTAGPMLVVVGLLHNPRSSYREVMGGVGRPFAGRGGSGVTVVTAGAYTNTGWYGELYVIPTVRAGAVALSSTVELAEPMNARGTRGLYVSPGNVLMDLGGGFAAGLGYYASFEAGSLPSQSAGPALQHAVPNGSVTMELIRSLVHASNEVRVTLRSSF